MNFNPLCPLVIAAALLIVPACGQTNSNQADGINDAFDNRPNEGLRDAGEDIGDAVKDAGRDIKDAATNN